MSHVNARLTFHGRCLLVRRVRMEGHPAAQVARELGVSRQCAYRWVRRYDAEGWAGLHDRSPAPRRVANRTPAGVQDQVIACRERLRQGPAFIAAAPGVPERTVSRIRRRRGVPRLADCDPLTGQIIRASKTTAVRYERSRPGELVHMDVKKLGKITGGGGWRAHGRPATSAQRRKRDPVGYDYVHVAVDDHSRLAYAEILPDEKGATAAAFLTRAAAYLAAAGIPAIERVITDDAWTYRRSTDFRQAAAAIGARQKFIRPHCLWQNGKAERLNRTLAIEWACWQPCTSGEERAAALPHWLEYYNTQRPHTALSGLPPITRLSPTS